MSVIITIPKCIPNPAQIYALGVVASIFLTAYHFSNNQVAFQKKENKGFNLISVLNDGLAGCVYGMFYGLAWPVLSISLLKIWWCGDNTKAIENK